MKLDEHRAYPVGPAGTNLSDPPARSRRRTFGSIFVAACVMSAVVGAASGTLIPPRVSGTSALYTSTAHTQISTITAGSWGSPSAAGCTGKYTFTFHTSQVNFQFGITSNSIVYIDSSGHFDFKGKTNICVIIQVGGVTVVNLNKTFYVVFGLPTGWLCCIPASSRCGPVGDDHTPGFQPKTAHVFARTAVTGDSGDSFEQQVQAGVAGGQITGLTIQPDTASGPTASPSSEPMPTVPSSPPVTAPSPADTSAASGSSGTDPGLTAAGQNDPS